MPKRRIVVQSAAEVAWSLAPEEVAQDPDVSFLATAADAYFALQKLFADRA